MSSSCSHTLNSSPAKDNQSQRRPQKGTCPQGNKFGGPELAVQETRERKLFVELPSVTSLCVHIHVHVLDQLMGTVS